MFGLSVDRLQLQNVSLFNFLYEKVEADMPGSDLTDRTRTGIRFSVHIFPCPMDRSVGPCPTDVNRERTGPSPVRG
jgi:hypothetical protein